jgi:RpiR family transcriptional regulator, carbohydrate utilization regulator
VRIAHPDLPKSDRKVADLVLSDPYRVLGLTVAETAVLAQVSQHLDRAAIASAIRILEGGKRIEFFGFGASGIVAADAQQKFPLFGVPCGAQSDFHQQIMVASMIGHGDVAVLISNTGNTRSIIQSARAARENDAKTIAITGSNTALAKACDVALIVETPDNTDFYTPTISRIAALVIIDILSTAVAFRRGEAHLARFKSMKTRLQELRTNREA